MSEYESLIRKERLSHADQIRLAELRIAADKGPKTEWTVEPIPENQTLEHSLNEIEKLGVGMTKEIAKREDNALVEMPVMERLLNAVQGGLSIEMLEKFMDLAERNEKREAEKAFNKAFSDFKADPPEIVKDQKVKFGNTKYEHASIGNVVRSIITGMAKHGLSHKWFLKQDGASITVTCRISHFLGHYEETSITAGADQSGGKNAIQAIASTITYLERYTLQAATGIAVLENDDDGRGAENVTLPPEKQQEQPREDEESLLTRTIAWIDGFAEKKATVAEFDEKIKKSSSKFKVFSPDNKQTIDAQIHAVREYLDELGQEQEKPEVNITI